jgi:hypothetical protein
MAQKRIVKKKTSPELNKKFTNIESKLQVIEDKIESKFTAMEDYIQSKFQGAIENYMNHSQKNTNNFDRIHSDLEDIKKNKKFKHRLLSKKRKSKKDDINSIETTDDTQEDKDSQLTDILANPMIQSLLSLDLSQIEDLLQNPMIQSLFSDNKSRKNRKKGKKSNGSSGFRIGNLLQNSKIQSLLKSF